MINLFSPLENSSFFRRLRRTWRKCWALTTGRYGSAVGAGVNEHLPSRIRAEQVRGVLRHTTSTLLATLVNAFVLVATLWPTAPHVWLAVWAGCLAGLVGLVAAPRLLSSNQQRHPRASVRAIWRINRNALLFGVMWGAAPALFFADASIGGKIVLVCLCAGMIGGGAFVYASVPTAAIAMITPIIAGAAWTLARSGAPEAAYAIFLMLVYSALLIRSAFLHTLDLMRKFVATAEIEHLSRRDSLTELDNSTTFRGIVTDAVLRLERIGEPCAIFIIDVDDLKRVNDARGHRVGDEVLVEAAARLRQLARRVDRLARLDGDQFAIIAPNLGGETTVRAYAARIVEAFARPFEHGEARLRVSACVGGFVAQTAPIGVETVMRNAELAVRKAQSKGSGSSYVFGPRDDAAQLERNALERDLRLALERDQLRLVYQPMVSLKTQRTTGFEALLRWRHPARGDISPAVFIPIAEETGLIEAFGAWVIREACATAAAWPGDLRLCLNVSAHQLRSRALCAQIAAAMLDNGLPASRIEVEITESIFIADDPLPLEILTSLRQSGVRLALDDFGTGYSSLSYLRRLPFDRIKIDRSFVTDIGTDKDCAAIVKSIISLASDLGMEVIAEGIETTQQMETLRRLNCPEIQGFLVGRPMPDADIAAYLELIAAKAAA